MLIAGATISVTAQQYNGQVKQLKDQQGRVVDELRLVSWSDQIPDQAMYDFSTDDIVTFADHNEALFLVTLASRPDPRWRSYVAVYFAEDIAMDRVVRYRVGAGTTRLRVPLDAPGYYYAVVIGPLADFVQLFHYDGKSVRRSMRRMIPMEIAEF